MAEQNTTPNSRKGRASEERLEQIRREALETGTVASGAGSGAGTKASGAGSANAGSSIVGAESYYNLPVLKEPTWTWEVPLYFFVGGIAGVSSVIALAAQLFGGSPQLIRMALWMAIGGAAICPIFLISDLGRPARFLNMLRVFKWRSPMSMGTWILVTFSGCAFMALVGNELPYFGYSGEWITALRWVGEFSGAVMGLLLATYTGVLVGATAIPVWNQHHRLLPTHFLTSGLGCSSGLLELFGFLIPGTQIIGYAAAGIETLIGVVLELQHGVVEEPLHQGRSGWTMRVAGTLEGPIALIVRIVWGGTATGRYAAALCFLVGALCSRYAWVWAGRASARNPQALFAVQRAAMKGRATAAGAKA